MHPAAWETMQHLVKLLLDAILQFGGFRLLSLAAHLSLVTLRCFLLAWVKCVTRFIQVCSLAELFVPVIDCIGENTGVLQVLNGCMDSSSFADGIMSFSEGMSFVNLFPDVLHWLFW